MLKNLSAQAGFHPISAKNAHKQPCTATFQRHTPGEEHQCSCLPAEHREHAKVYFLLG